MSPAMMILGWERFNMARFTQTADAARLLQTSRYFLTPDGLRFAPVRLMAELGMGKPLAQAEADAQGFTGLRAQLESNGWRVLRSGDDGFDKATAAWTADCKTLAPDANPDPDQNRIFVVPA